MRKAIIRQYNDDSLRHQNCKRKIIWYNCVLLFKIEITYLWLQGFCPGMASQEGISDFCLQCTTWTKPRKQTAGADRVISCGRTPSPYELHYIVDIRQLQTVKDRSKQYAISQPLVAGDAITKVIIKRSRATWYTAQARAGDIRCNRFMHRKWAWEDVTTVATVYGRVKTYWHYKSICIIYI